jgi:hypothetical protein
MPTMGATGYGTATISPPPIMADPRLKYVVRTDYKSVKPRAVAVIYGISAQVLDYKIVHNSHGIADTATITLAAHGGIDWSEFLKDPVSNIGSVIVKIYAGYPSDPSSSSVDIAQLDLRFIGTMDMYNADGLEANWVFQCSSLATLLMAEKQTTLEQGKNSKQYIQSIADAAGLKADFGKSPPVNGYHTLAEVFGKAEIVGVHNVRPWTIGQACAQADDVYMWLRLDTLYYWRPDFADTARKHLLFSYGQQFVNMTLQHGAMNKNIEVEVRTWSAKTRVSHTTRYLTDGSSVTKYHHTVTLPNFGSNTSEAVTTNSDGSASVSQIQSTGGSFNSGSTTIPRATSKIRYIYHIPNLTPAQADERAYTIWLQLSRATYQATVVFVVTPEILPYLNIESVLEIYSAPWQMANTGTIVPGGDDPNNPDRSLGYFQRQLEESFNAEGWVCTSRCLNHSTPQGAQDSSFVGDTGV